MFHLETVREDQIRVAVRRTIPVDIELLHSLLFRLIHALHCNELTLIPPFKNTPGCSAAERALCVNHQRVPAVCTDQHLHSNL